MAYHWMTWLPAVLRAAGLEVVEHSGWKSRGLSAARAFEPEYVVWHHDASAKGDSPGVPDFMIRNFATAGAQTWVDRKGRWHIVAAGRAAHAGKTLPGKPTNTNSLGVETDHTTGEAWPDALLSSLRTGTKAILEHMGHGASHLEFHKTICSPPGRKVDPDGLNLSTERQRVAGASTEGDDMSWDETFSKWAPESTPNSGKQISAAQQLNQARGYAEDAWDRTVKIEARVARIEKAIEALGDGISAQVGSAVKAALKDAVIDVDVNVNKAD